MCVFLLIDVFCGMDLVFTCTHKNTHGNTFKIIIILFRSRLCKRTEHFLRLPLYDLYTIILINYKDLKLFNIHHIIYRVSPNKFLIFCYTGMT